MLLREQFRRRATSPVVSPLLDWPARGLPGRASPGAVVAGAEEFLLGVRFRFVMRILSSARGESFPKPCDEASDRAPRDTKSARFQNGRLVHALPGPTKCTCCGTFRARGAP